MSAFVLVIECAAVALLTLWVLRKYVAWREHSPLFVSAVSIGWFFSFLIVLVLPLDVSNTFYNRCLYQSELKLNETLNATTAAAAGQKEAIIATTVVAPTENLTPAEAPCERPGVWAPDDAILELWRVAYWTSQILTWLALPLMESFSSAGDFSTVDKLKSALRSNLLYYALYAIVLAFLLCYALLKGLDLSWEHLWVIVVSASNTWGLVLLTVLLGHGLVEVPRTAWNNADLQTRLMRAYFEVQQLAGEKSEAETDLADVYREALACLDATKHEPSVARHCLQVILSRFSPDAVDVCNSYADRRRPAQRDAHALHNINYLTSLHGRVIGAVSRWRQITAQWESALDEAVDVEFWATAERLARPPASLEPAQKSGLIQNPKLLYYWHCRARTPLTKALAVLLSTCSVLLVLSECTFFLVHPTLSPAALLLEHVASAFHYKYTQFLCIFLLGYLCVCAYATVLRTRVFRLYALDPRGHTDIQSLLFSAMMLCRLTPPICLNFLGLVHLDSHISQHNYRIETQFTKLMGHLDVIPFLARGINVYLPISILLLCALTYYRLGTRVAHQLGFEQFLADDRYTHELVDAGRTLVSLEKRLRDRKAKKTATTTTTATATTSTTAASSIGSRESSALMPREMGRGERATSPGRSAGMGIRLPAIAADRERLIGGGDEDEDEEEDVLIGRIGGSRPTAARSQEDQSSSAAADLSAPFGYHHPDAATLFDDL